MADPDATDRFEVWKPVPGYARFEASEFGHIRRAGGDRIYPQYLDAYGYFTIALGNKKRKRSSLMICAAFHGPRPSLHHFALHNNGNRRDNRATNLRWGTQLENCEDRDRHGRTLHGSSNHQSKLTEEIAREVRQLCEGGRYGGGALQKDLAQKHGVSKAAISMIVRGLTWKRA